MVEIGERPMLWHIMKMYERHGFNDFILALGYKGDVIKDYFLHYHARHSDLTVQLGSGCIDYANPTSEDWRVALVDTGLDTMTGGRLLRLKSQLHEGGTFMLTYGDGVSDVDITALLEFHRSNGRLATVTAVRHPVRFGVLGMEGNRVVNFVEKPQVGEGWINGGFFVFEPGVFDCIGDDATILEREPLERLAQAGELMAYRHDGYWQCMDTYHDKVTLEKLWASGHAPWKT